jgi:hypothetical protein
MFYELIYMHILLHIYVLYAMLNNIFVFFKKNEYILIEYPAHCTRLPTSNTKKQISHE